jgi:hypothetical protein
MVVRQLTSRLVARLIICTLVCSSVAWLGCSSEVGSVPESKSASSPLVQKDRDDAAPTNWKQGAAPKSIKAKVLGIKKPTE